MGLLSSIKSMEEKSLEGESSVVMIGLRTRLYVQR